MFGCNELILIALDSTQAQASTHSYIPFPLPGTSSQVPPIPTQLPGELLFMLQGPAQSPASLEYAHLTVLSQLELITRVALKL